MRTPRATATPRCGASTNCSGRTVSTRGSTWSQRRNRRTGSAPREPPARDRLRHPPARLGGDRRWRPLGWALIVERCVSRTTVVRPLSPRPWNAFPSVPPSRTCTPTCGWARSCTACSPTAASSWAPQPAASRSSTPRGADTTRSPSTASRAGSAAASRWTRAPPGRPSPGACPWSSTTTATCAGATCRRATRRAAGPPPRYRCGGGVRWRHHRPCRADHPFERSTPSVTSR